MEGLALLLNKMKSNLIKLLLIGLVPLSLAGCMTFRDVPVGTSRSPHVSGRSFSVSLGTGTTNTRHLFIAKEESRGNEQVTSRIDKSPEHFFYERALSSHVYNIVGSIDFAESFSVFFDNGLYGLQWQFFGPSRSEKTAGQFSSSMLLAYTQVTKRARRIAMAEDDSYGDGRQFSHIGNLSWLAGFDFTEGFGIGTSLGLQPVISSFDGTVDSDTFSSEIEQSTVDYLLGALLNFYGENSEVVLGHQWNYVLDPITEGYYTNLYVTLRWSYTF